MKSSLSALGLALVSGISADALRFKVTGRRNDPTSMKRAVAGSSPLANSADISYQTNITVGGSLFSVLIDTGSADLWVAGTVPNAVDSGKTSGVQYAVGSVQGPIKFAPVEFAGYTVADQAFLQVTPDSSNPEGTGLIGLGPVGGSNIYSTIPTKQGATPLDRIFLQNTSTPNYLTVLLGRTGDPTDIFAGDLSVGETLDGYADVLNQKKQAVTIVPVRQAGDQHFQLLLDTDGLLGPDGKAISLTTEVTGTSNKKQATAVVDTGFSLSQLPKSAADAIYSRFAGAEFVNVTGIGAVWIVPCDQEVNITFQFNDQQILIHPMDATLNPTILGMDPINNSEGKKSCLGMFQPISFDTGNSPDYDMILGMSFIRNVYALFNYGDFIAGSTSTDNRGDPYIQFLSTTVPSEAHSDFVSVRLGGKDTTGDQVLLPASSSGSNSNSSSSFYSRNKTYLIIGAICLAAAGLVAIVSLVICGRRRHTRFSKGGARELGTYAALDAPEQKGIPLSSAPKPYNPQYGQPLYDPPSQQGYQNPWDHRY
ncbi:aspartic peptidase domain-containing protein [Mycena floridula]|nr:aspartic peptidase domain-containing protein [Mycena floridula]